MLFTIIFVIASAFQTYDLYLLLRCFFRESKINTKKELVAYSLFFIVGTMQYLFINMPILSLCTSYGGLTLISVFVYREGWKKGIISSTLTYVIMTLAECVVAVLSGYLDLSLFGTTEYYSIFGIVCIPIVQYLSVLIIKNMKNIRKGEDIPVSYWILSISLPIITIYLHILLYRQKNIEPVELAIGTAMLFVMDIFVLYLYDRQIETFRIKREKENLELQNQYQIKQLELMNQNSRQVKAQRHDLKKHISMITLFHKEGQRERLTEYLNEMQKSISLQQRYVETGNFVFDSILNYKLQEAFGEGIEVQIDTAIPKELSLSAYDINIILANLLDNSMEAVRKTGEKKINVVIRYKINSLFIKIDNPFKEIHTDENGDYVTNKEDKENHGYGLQNVKQSVDKYGGALDIRTKENIFSVTAVIPV